MSDTISTSETRRAVRAYAALLGAASLALALACAVAYGVGRWEAVLALAVVAYVAESRTVRISTRVELSGSLIPLVMAAILFGPAAAAIVGLGAMLSDRRGPVERFVIFTCGRVAAGACAGLAAMAVQPPATDAGLGHLFAVACVTATAASAVEFCVTALTLWLRHRSSVVELWRQVRVHALITVSLCAPVGALFAYAYRGSGIWVLVFFAIPVAATRYAFGMHAPKEHLIGALERANADLESANSHLRRINMSFAEALVKAIDGRDAYTAGHSKAVAEYSRDIARELGMSREDAARIHLCGLVHDIGKIGVRAEVLEKQAALDEGEWEEMRRHSTIGEAILLEVPGYADMAEVVRSHHERWDGAGYPDNLRGEQIPRLARLIAVADSYNAMTSNRPYRGGMSPERAIEQLVLGKGSQYEPGPVDAFLRVLERAPGWYRRGQFAIDAAGIAAVETMEYPVSMTPRAAA